MRDYYCLEPFTSLVVADGGYAFICACPFWNDHFCLGNVFEVDDVWNGPLAQQFRRSIWQGDFAHCNRVLCPSLANKNQFVRKKESIDSNLQGEEQILRDNLTCEKVVSDHRPLNIFLAYDAVCNLRCPSCRGEDFRYTTNDRLQAEKLHRIVEEKYLGDASRITVGGAGDPFASPTFLQFFKTLNREKCKRLQELSLLTNGLNFKKHYFDMSPLAKESLAEIDISIDAACEQTYLINRRGGSWSTLLESLDFLSDLKSKKLLKRLHFHFVVQQNNYKEMSAFVDFAQNYDVDYIDFQLFGIQFLKLSRPETYFYEWEEKAVHEPHHCENQQFCQVLKEFFNTHQKRIEEGKVYLGNLKQVLDGTYLGQRENYKREFEKN